MLWATVIEFGVLALTALPVVRSFMAHSAADPNSASNNLLAEIGIYFHYPSFLIVMPFDGVLFAPIIQIILMGAVLFLVFAWRRRRQASAPQQIVGREAR